MTTPPPPPPPVRTAGNGASAPTVDRDVASDGPVAEQNDVRIGRVVSVSGSQVIILLDEPADSAMKPTKGAPQIGALVKMRTAGSTVYGLVSGLSIPVPAKEAGAEELDIVELELLGEALVDDRQRQGAFERGVSVYPSLGDPVYASTQEDLRQVYAKPTVSSVRIGTIHQDQSLPAFVVTDDLLGKHFAILGTTGSGKSCALALTLRAILSRHPHGHVLLLDPHNEYSHAFGDSAEVIAPADLELPYWLLNFEEIKELMIGGNGDRADAEATILSDAVITAKRQYLTETGSTEIVTVDTPVPFRLSDVVRMLDEAMGKLEKPENSAPFLRLKTRLAALQSDRRFAFMFPGLQVRDNMASILSRIFRIPVNGKPLTIVDLSGVPSEILDVVVSLLCRMTFDFALWSDRAVPTMLVCEEAHRYATLDSRLGFESTKKALSKIAKEGRKYGVSLCVVSQRPSELATGMLSQCNTIFALRMSNQKDQEYVRGALSDSALGLMDSLPSLRNAEAIVVGEGVSVPMRLCFDELPEEHRPRSGTASFSKAWDKEVDGAGFIDETIGRWRRQQR